MLAWGRSIIRLKILFKKKKKSKAMYRIFGESCICQKHVLSVLPKKTNDKDKTGLNNM